MDTAAARKAKVAALKAMVDARLSELTPAGGAAVAAAMRYAVLTPGKRLRPLLVILTASQLGRPAEAALDVACAVEMVHAASLVLDDLPCMDDAALRRGAPSTHARFGQDVAVLTGVALLNQAYAVLARAADISPTDRLEMIEALSGAVGLEGLVAGQALDLHEAPDTLSTLREAHHRKTGVLFMAAVNLGALIGGARVSESLSLERFAAELGLAFQARDDVADAEEVDRADGVQTLVRLLGRDGAAREADNRLGAAKRALEEGGGRLAPLAAYVDMLLGDLMTEAQA